MRAITTARREYRRRYVVETHLGPEETVATSAAKALSNVKFRMRRRGVYGPYTYWTVKEAGV